MLKNHEAILNIIQSTEGHMTAEEIFMKCRERGLKMSVATVYRNLGNMSEQGIVRKISIVGQPDHYDRTMTRHEHLICERCGKLQDVCIDNLEELLESKVGMKLNSYELCMRYICPECRKSEKK